jgi:RNA polymerase sigma-70 factor (ECF subfamily)
MGDDFERTAQAGARSRRDMDEREAVKESQKGDRMAFGHLIDRHYRGLYRFAYQCLGNHGDADDVCQETFLQALGRIQGLRDDACFRPWIYKIALNLVRRRRQRHRAEALFVQPLRREAPGAVEALKGQERMDRVREEISKLPQPLQVATILVLMDGATQKEAASIMGCSEATVSRHLETAREVLRQRLRHLTD